MAAELSRDQEHETPAEPAVPPVEVIAHRGLTSRAGENTVAAFRAALDERADGIELDVQVTRDGTLVVHHDPVLGAAHHDRAGMLISSLSLAELQGEAPGETGIPTLQEVLELVDGRLQVYVEIKASRIEALVCAQLSGRSDWCAVHSFDHRTIARVRSIDPTVPRGVLMSSYLVDPLVPLHDTGARDLWQECGMIDQALIQNVHQAGGRVIAWTVNDFAMARQLIDWGVDGLCTDRGREIVQPTNRATAP